MTSWSRRVSVASRPTGTRARAEVDEQLLTEAVALGVGPEDRAALAALVHVAREHPGFRTTHVVRGEQAGSFVELTFEISSAGGAPSLRLLGAPGQAPLAERSAVEGPAEAEPADEELDGEAVRQILTDTLVETPDPVAIFASVGREALWANDAFVTTIPIRATDNLWLVELLDEWSRGHYEVKVLPALVKFGRWRGRLTFLSDDGAVPVSAVIVAHRDAAGDIAQVSLVARDLSELRVAEERVAASETRFAALVEYATDLIAVVDPDGTVRYLSPAVSRTLGHAEGALDGTNVLDLVHPDDTPEDWTDLAQPDDQGIGRPVVLRVRTVDGEWRHLEVIVTDLTANPAIGGLVLNARDVTERVVAARDLAAQAYLDPLTGLPNRVRLFDRLASLLESSTGSVVVLICDIDQFKPLNAVVGVEGGDEVLRHMAERLRDAVGDQVTLARHSGDTFVALVPPPSDVAAALRLAARVREAVGAPFEVDGRHVQLSLSVGVADSRPGDDPDQLIRRAERAMGKAKQGGGDRTEVFDDALAEADTRRHTIDQQLRRALEADGLRVHFQPIVDIASDEVVGAEALLRLHDDDGMVLSPAEFVEAAESNGLISELGRQVLQTTSEQLAAWLSSPAPGLPREVSVNVSPRQLADPELPTQVQHVLAATGLDPSALSLEITESILIGAEPTVDAGISYLRSLGVRIGLDDFGTGQSSLGYLKRFPLDFVKIDRSLIAGLGLNEQDTAIVRATVELAHSLGLVVTAVGVENEEQLDALDILGCDRAQGYLFAPPVPADRLATAIGS